MVAQLLQVKYRASDWFQGADGTNTLYANSTAGVLIQTPGSTANNNDSKIYFRNHGTTVKHTLILTVAMQLLQIMFMRKKVFFLTE